MAIAGFSQFYMFQALPSNETQVWESAKKFENIGWKYLGVMPLGNVKFIRLGWPAEKGDPVYPQGHQPHKDQQIDLDKPPRPLPDRE